MSETYQQALNAALAAAAQLPKVATDSVVAVPPADVPYGIEKFTAKDLATLRNDLLQSGVDSFQAAELVASFLGGRGYGISAAEARDVVQKVEGLHCTVERLEEELDRVARAS